VGNGIKFSFAHRFRSFRSPGHYLVLEIGSSIVPLPCGISRSVSCTTIGAVNDYFGVIRQKFPERKKIRWLCDKDFYGVNGRELGVLRGP
jgi:hypothetical protein